jgi:hypothetical protein
MSFIIFLYYYSYRWLKFEEAVEEYGNRWSKPHVGTLRHQSLSELRSMLRSGTFMLDVDASSAEELTKLVTQNMKPGNSPTTDCTEKVD